MRDRRSRSDSSNPPELSRSSLTKLTSYPLPILHPAIVIADLDLSSAEEISHARIHPELIRKIIAYDGVNYHIYSKGKLGEGSFGEVVLAQNAETGEWIALKHIKQMKEHLHEKYLHKEIESLKSADALIFHLHHVDEGDYIGMKLHTGFELHRILNGIINDSLQAFSYSQKMLIAKRILKAAAELHNAAAAIINPELKDVVSKIIHRDLKAKNMMIDHDLQIRIVDFGLAAIVDDKKRGLRDTEMVGTRMHVAPETGDGPLPEYNEKTEVYALGMVLANLLYYCEESHNIDKANKTDGLMKLTEDMLHPDPDKRPNVNEAYQRLNHINSNHVHSNANTHAADFLVYTISLRDLHKLAHVKQLDVFARELVSQGAKSIAVIGDIVGVESAELVMIQRALYKAGIFHIAPIVYSTKAGQDEAMVAVANYYNRTFGTATTSLLSSHTIAKNILKKDGLIKSKGFFAAISKPPNKILPAEPVKQQKN